jgi:hypothetical protein
VKRPVFSGFPGNYQEKEELVFSEGKRDLIGSGTGQSGLCHHAFIQMVHVYIFSIFSKN